MQETFVAVYHHFDKYNGNGSFEGWIKRIAINNCLQKLRLDKKQFLIKDIGSENLENISEELVDFEHNENLEKKLIQALKDLPINYRTILNLAIIENFTHKEISAVLNITENTSRINLSRARTLLKEKITQHGG